MQGFKITIRGIKTVSLGAKIVKVSLFFHATGTRLGPEFIIHAFGLEGQLSRH